MDGKRFRIPNEDIRLDDVEVEVTQTRVFQRLFFLKQLGLAYLVYPAASHTRGHHSLQCLHEAEKILRALDDQGHTIDPDDRQAVRMAALLHDIGHVPFSHSLEDEHVILQKHDRRERVAGALTWLSSEVTEEGRARIDAAKPILLALSGDQSAVHDWRSDIVGNTVCADLLAYIVMDAAWTGIEKKAGYYRVYDYFTLRSDGNNERLCVRLTKGGLRTDIVSAILDLLDMRYALTERVYFHHGKAVASSMLARAARLYGIDSEKELTRIGDESFLDRLGTRALATNNTDALVSGLRSRQLYKRIFKIGRVSRNAWDTGREQTNFCAKWRDPAEVEPMLGRVEEVNGLPSGSLAMWCPERKTGMKLARAQVVWESGDTPGELYGPVELRELGDRFPGVSERVETIEDQYEDLWSLWVAIDRRLLEKAPGVVGSLEEEFGIKCDPVFLETHLQQMEGFGKGRRRLSEIGRIVRSVGPAVEARIREGAAYGGEESVTDEAVFEALQHVAEEKRRPQQEQLPIDQERKGPEVDK